MRTVRTTKGELTGAHPVLVCHGEGGPCVLWKPKSTHGPPQKHIPRPYPNPFGWALGQRTSRVLWTSKPTRGEL